MGLFKNPLTKPIPDAWTQWYAGKALSSNWASGNFAVWDAHLSDLRATGAPLNILEIGSWEGGSAIFFLEYFEGASITCVDTFDGGQDDYGSNTADFPMIERRFDSNLASYAGRVRKMKSTSARALVELGEEGSRFDLIYIDGAHDRDTVHTDSLLAWPLLKEGGVTIWDDYEWRRRSEPIDRRPEEAINLFVASRHGDIELLHRKWQLIARKVRNGTKFGARSLIAAAALRALRLRRI